MMDKIESRIDIRGGPCVEEKPQPCGLVIFGASGDLTHRKLIPALFSLFQRDLLPHNFFILGCARTEMTDETFRQKVRDSIINGIENIVASNLNSFIRRCAYHSGDYQDKGLYSSLSERLQQLDKETSIAGNHVFYFATPPNLYAIIGYQLGVSNVLSERQIYRIDHYLGKETVQNILMFRFANAVFEPIWNRRYVDHVQITVAESIGVEHRARYFEQAGLLRDMFQNHILQMLALVAMEPSVSFDADRVRDERVKLLCSIRPFPLNELDRYIVRGQYGPGSVDGVEVPGYRQEEGVASDSQVETFLATKLFIDNWRWTHYRRMSWF